MEIKLLIVEDDKTNIETYELNIKSYNEEHVNNVKIVPYFKRNLDAGLESLKSDFFDGAIIDIKLSPDDMEGGGNQILKEIKSNLRFPVFIITGYPQNIEEELKKENVFWKIYKRDEVDIRGVLDEIVDVAKTGIISILGNKGYIEEYLKKIFWEHIADNLMEIRKYSPEEKIELVLLRFVSSYLMEYLDTKSSSDILYIPAEFYIKPLVRAEYFTGDILKDKSNGEFLVILTPPCDMVKRTDGTRNAELFLCAKIRQWNRVEGSFQEITRSTGRNNPKRKDLEKYMKNKKERYHFVPPYKDIPAGFIDFQTLKSLSEDEIKDNHDRIATISPLFMRDIVARFSRYYARQGQPDLDIDKIIQEMLPDESSE